MIELLDKIKKMQDVLDNQSEESNIQAKNKIFKTDNKSIFI